MTKRNIATVLWFVAGWWGGSLAAGLMGLPMILAYVPGILLAGLVRWDPTGALWSRSGDQRRIIPIDQFAQRLDAKAGARPAPESDRTIA